MRRPCTCVLVGILLLGFSKTPVQAQQVQAEVGPRVGLDRYGFRYFAGADVRTTVPGLTLGSRQLPILVNPFVSYHFSVAGPGGAFRAALNRLCDDCVESSGSLSRFGANALVNLSEWGTDEEEGFPSDVYLGAGLALSRLSYERRITVESGPLGDGGSIRYEGSDLVPGLNLVANATFSGSSFATPFVQARITLAPRASVNLQKSVIEESAVLENYPESQEYKTWEGTSFLAISAGVLFGL